ncbi:24826_t:CDS:1, partial [Gigaspora margarita]
SFLVGMVGMQRGFTLPKVLANNVLLNITRTKVGFAVNFQYFPLTKYTTQLDDTYC